MSDSLTRLTGGSRTRFVVVKDPKVGKHTHEQRAQLRSLPLLYEFGFRRFLHTSLWDNGFKMADYEYVDPSQTSAGQFEYPLVQVASMEGLTKHDVEFEDIDRHGEQHIVNEILRTRSKDDIYVLVTDSNAPKLPEVSTQRPITDEYGPVTTVDYESLVEREIRNNLNSRLPLKMTKNYYFHEISDHHQRLGAPARSLQGMFDYEQAPPYSPVWKPLYHFVENDLQQVLEKYTERIRETLRSWLERGDVQKIATQMDAVLTRCEYRTDELDRIRAENAEQYDIDFHGERR